MSSGRAEVFQAATKQPSILENQFICDESNRKIIVAESIDFILKQAGDGRQSVVTNNLSSSNGDFALRSNIYGDNYTTHNQLPLL